MAEEKIAIAKMITNTDKDGSANLEHFKIYGRQEAIEKMGVAIKEKLFKDGGYTKKIEEKGLQKEYDNFILYFSNLLAEAALNALLGGTK